MANAEREDETRGEQRRPRSPLMLTNDRLQNFQNISKEQSRQTYFYDWRGKRRNYVGIRAVVWALV